MKGSTSGHGGGGTIGRCRAETETAGRPFLACLLVLVICAGFWDKGKVLSTSDGRQGNLAVCLLFGTAAVSEWKEISLVLFCWVSSGRSQLLCGFPRASVIPPVFILPVDFV